MALTERQRSLIVPREHGAWGILLIPLGSGAAVGLHTGGRAWPLAPLTAAVLALFWLRTPVESWIGSTPVRARSRAEFRLVRRVSLALAAVSAAALVWLFQGGLNRQLLWLGALAGAAFVAQGLIRRVSRRARAAAQMVGAAGLTVAAPAAYSAVTGRLDFAGWPLWAFNFLFAANQIQYVQLRIRSAHAAFDRERQAMARPFLGAQFLTAGLLAAGCFLRLFHWYVALAFVPLLWRGFAWYLAPFQPLAVHALGKRELAHGIAFGALLAIALSVTMAV